MAAKKFTLKLKAEETNPFGRLVANLIHMSCDLNDPAGELAGMTLNEWFEAKKGRLVFPEAAKFSLGTGVAFALHYFLGQLEHFPHVFNELDRYVVNERRRRQSLYKQTQDGEAI